MATWIDVADTAIKIGLGAAIAAVATYFHARQKYFLESKQKYALRRQEIIEEVGASIAEIDHIYLKYAALIQDGIRLREKEVEWGEKRLSDYSAFSTDLFHAFKNLTNAESKLRLIEETQHCELLREYGSLIGEFRTTFHRGNSDITSESLHESKRKIKEARESLFAALSTSYKTDFI